MKPLKLKSTKPVIDIEHDFMPVICDNKKRNGYFCNTWLGEIEVSRANVSKHRCRDCKITYRHIVSPDGCVEREVSTDVILNTKTVVRVEKLDAHE